MSEPSQNSAFISLDSTSWYSLSFCFSKWICHLSSSDLSECGNVSFLTGEEPPPSAVLLPSGSLSQLLEKVGDEGRDCEEPEPARGGVAAQGPGRSFLAHTYTWVQEGANDGGICEDDYFLMFFLVDLFSYSRFSLTRGWIHFQETHKSFT